MAKRKLALKKTESKAKVKKTESKAKVKKTDAVEVNAYGYGKDKIGDNWTPRHGSSTDIAKQCFKHGLSRLEASKFLVGYVRTGGAMKGKAYDAKSALKRINTVYNHAKNARELTFTQSKNVNMQKFGSEIKLLKKKVA